jgi:uncharacterized protein HemX
MKVIAIVALLASILIALAMVVGAWQFSASRKARVALTRDTDYRRLAEEYRRLAEMAITSQEHTDLKLGDVTMQIGQVREQLESVQRILKDVE